MGEFAGFDAVSGGFGFSLFGFWTLAFGSVIAGDLGSLFVGHGFLLLKWKRPSFLARAFCRNLRAPLGVLCDFVIADGGAKTNFRFINVAGGH